MKPPRRAWSSATAVSRTSASSEKFTEPRARGAAARASLRRARFDVITTDPIHPYVAGSASLYTTEHLRLSREDLIREICKSEDVEILKGAVKSG
jgi:hypothetical protein